MFWKKHKERTPLELELLSLYRKSTALGSRVFVVTDSDWETHSKTFGRACRDIAFERQMSPKFPDISPPVITPVLSGGKKFYKSEWELSKNSPFEYFDTEEEAIDYHAEEYKTYKKTVIADYEKKLIPLNKEEEIFNSIKAEYNKALSEVFDSFCQGNSSRKKALRTIDAIRTKRWPFKIIGVKMMINDMKVEARFDLEEDYDDNSLYALENNVGAYLAGD